jgi:L-seryl-tRNA(Ser) seleniumtransferase
MSPHSLPHLPTLHELLESPPLKTIVDRFSGSTVISTVATMLDEIRREVQNAAVEMALPSVTDVAERIVRRIAEDESSLLRPVINATGILLHERLGPAPLAEEAVAEMLVVARGYTNQNLDLASGRPLRRLAAIENLLRELTGAERALVVHSKAGAVMLMSAALAAGRELIVARSQLNESEDGCRLSDMIVAGGAALREVGAANNVRLDDYAQALGDATAALMLVQPSNYVVAGSMGSVALRELIELAGRRKLVVIHDVGAGGLLDVGRLGLCPEPVVAESVKAGADAVLFCGDKLLGGPQCAILVGRRALIEKLERHPAAGAMQADRLTLAALNATLRLYREPEKARLAIPLLRLLHTSAENLKNRAERLAPQAAATAAIAEARAVAGESCLMGEVPPNRQLLTWCVSLRPATMSVDRLAAALRGSEPSVVGRVYEDRLLIDLRSVLPCQDAEILLALERLGQPSATTTQG